MQKIEKIYEDYYQIVYKYLFCLTHDKDLSEDLAQETFVKMIKNIDKFKGKSKFLFLLVFFFIHIFTFLIKLYQHKKVLSK